MTECHGYPTGGECDECDEDFFIEAIVTCVNYSDFLAETLPINRHLFDRLVIITAPEDKKTRRVCEYWNVECVLTDGFGARWDRFDKARGINSGLRRLSKKGWVLQLDADIALPPLTRNLLERGSLDRSMLYGIDRHLVVGQGAWRKHMAMPELQHEDGAYVHLGSFPLATRFASSGHGGYMPIGFFQLWNPAGSGITSYPEEHTDAGRTDMLFADRWPRQKRGFIPEIVGYHLESEQVPQGANWNGRTSRPWGGS